MTLTKYQDVTPVTGTRIIEPSNGDCSIVQNNYFGSGAIANKKPATTSQNGFDALELAIFAAGLSAFIAVILGLVWLGGQAFNEWSATRETSAQQELTRLRECINN